MGAEIVRNGLSEYKLKNKDIKLQNRFMIYNFIKDNHLVSKQDIVSGLRISLPTVTQNLKYLSGEDLIDTSSQIRNTGGRNATAYSIRAKARVAIGISLTGHHITGVSVDLAGAVGSVIRCRIPFNLNDDTYLKKIGEIVEDICKKEEIAPSALLGVGISVPGLISEDGEEVVYGRTLQFSGRKKEEICRYISYPTRLFHDSYTAGYAEAAASPDLKYAFYISLGSSVGGAIIGRTEIFPGDNNRAGEIGHMLVAPGSRKRCYCGNYGCFDCMCNAGVLDQYTEGDLAEFFRQKDEGNAQFVKVWNKYLDDLAIAVHNVRVLGDIKVVLGGYVGPYVNQDFENLYERVDKLNPFDDKAQTYLIPCRSTVESVAVGAAQIFLDEFLEELATKE
ncbi:MAG: ROK family protein [Blautia sp.]|nr:ROK family protein [Blautia sp.]